MRQRKSPWIYMVYTWDFPFGCYTSAASAVAAVIHVTRNWKEPFSFGSVKVVRYRPSVAIDGCVEEDVTDMILRVSRKMRKEAVIAK